MLDDARLLLTWERGYQALPVERALLLASLADPETPVESLVLRAIGERDASLLRLRRRIFGDQVESVTQCPQCHQSLELNFDLGNLLKQESKPGQGPQRLECDGFVVGFRAPTSADILQLVSLPHRERATKLLRLCILATVYQGAPVAVEHLPQPVLDRIAKAISQADPFAEIEFDLTCVQCQHTFHSPFDIVAFLWSELNAWCQRRLLEVHTLAKAYGWSERETLSLSPWRRQVYLNMVRQ